MSAHCRAGWTLHLLRTKSSLSEPHQQELDKRLAHSEQLLQASPAGRFLPFEVHMQVLTALRQVLGARGYREYCARAVTAALHEPLLFAKQARAALRAVSDSRWRLLQALPVSCRFIFQDAGPIHVTVAADDRSATIEHHDFEPNHSTGDVWALIWLGTIDAIAQFALAPGGESAEVTLVEHVPERGYFKWLARLQ